MAEVIDTRADVEAVAAALTAELAKPEAEQDLDLIRRATAVVSAFPEAGLQAPAAGTQAFEGTPVTPRKAEAPGQGFPTQVSPAEQLSQRALVSEAKNRGEDIVNFLRRPFLSDAEQAKEAEEIRVRRAQEQLQLEADARAAGVDPASLKPAQITGGLAPDIAASALGGIGLPRTVGGALTRIATEAGIGAVLGGSTTPLDEDPTNAALLDGGITLGLGTLTEIPGLAADFLRREIRAARNSTQDEALRRISDDVGIDLTIAERTQVPAAITAETSVAARPDGPRAQFLEQRKGQLQDAFNRIEATLNPDQLSSAQVISQTRQAYDDTISGMAALASQQFRNNLEPALGPIGARLDNEGRILGGFKFIQAPELVNELRVQRRLLAEQPLTKGTNTALRQLDKEISRIEEQGLDLGQVQRLLKDLAAQNAPTGIVIKDASQAQDILSTSAVQRALSRDLDRIAAGGDDVPEEFATAVGSLQDARRQFARERADIDVFKDTAVDKLLGKVGDPTSRDFAAKVINLDAPAFNTMLEIADDADPLLGNAIRGVVFKEILDKHTKLGVLGSDVARTAQNIEVEKIIGELTKMPMSKLQAFTGSNLSAADSQHMRNTLVALQAIAEGPTGKNIHAQTLRNRAEQWAINAASRDQGFIARLLAGEMAPGVIERMLFTEQGQRALTNLSRPKVIGPQLAQSFTYLSTVMSEDEKARAELERQRLIRGLDEPGRFRAL